MNETAKEVEPVVVEPFHDGRRIARIGLLIIAATFGLGGLWVVTASLSGAVISDGVVKVDSHRKTVQHLEGGIVKEILVKEGERVRRGQPLLLLEEVQTRATVAVLSTQMAEHRLREARLEAERQFADRPDFPKDLVRQATSDPGLARMIRAEADLFRARRQMVDSQAAILKRELAEVEQEVAGLKEQLKGAEAYLNFINEELRMNESLAEQKLTDQTRVLAIRRAKAEKEERRGEYIAAMARAAQRTSETELRAISLRENYVKEAAAELKETQNKIQDLEERLQPAEDALERQTIRAPIDGTVMDLKVTTVGGVVRAGEPLMEVVPDDGQLIVEGKIKPNDINDVAVGKPAEVRLTAFNARTTPLVLGEVVYVSADAMVEKGLINAEGYYLVHVRLDPKSLGEAGNLELYPGMPAQMFIKTHDRTPLEYMLQPVMDTLRTSFREP